MISAQTHVVVFVGIPGDAETESAYTRQIDRLLELLARANPRPREVTVFADAPELVRAPTGSPVQVIDGSRARLAELASKLAADDLVAFVWGHGGLRGRDPVLHVRGPRVEPEDLVALGKVAARSTWFLFFRQSGSFARKLRGPGRAIVSSEADTAFRSDPVAFELLLDLLRDRPGAGVEALARALGPATVAWYDENRLARTEEPTLWLGAGEPVRLADATDEAPGAVAAAEAAATEAGGWEGITPARLDDHPGAPAVVLRRSVVHTIGTSPALSSVVEEFVQVLSRDGERYAQVDVAFSPPDEALHLLDLERRSPDGTIERIDPDVVGDWRPAAPDDYRTVARRAGELPGAEPGAIFRIRYRREWKSFPLPHVYLEVPLAGRLPVAAMSVGVSVDREGPFHWGFRHHEPIPPETGDGRYGRTHRWQFEGLDAVVPETLVAPARTPALLVSTFPDWTAFSAWYRRLIRTADSVTPEIEAAVEQITAGAVTPREKVQRLTEFVTGLRYVAVPLGVNSHRPHAAANVLRNRYGDCKDKANLLNTMLGGLGIEADLVLVPRFSQTDEATPGLGFNHAISRVRLGDEVLWIDTTDETTRFGLLPPGDPGRKVLVIDETTTGLTMLPEPLASEHRLELEMDVSLDGETPSGRIDAGTTGFIDYRLRQAAQRRADFAQNAPLLSHAYRPINGHFSLLQQESTNASELERPFAWKASGAWSGLVTATADGSRAVRAPFWLPVEWEEALHERRAPLHLNDGYPFELRETVHFIGNGKLAGRPLPSDASGQSDPLRWGVTWSRSRKTTVARLQATLSRADLNEAETRAFQRELRRLLDALAIGIRLANP